MSGAWPETVTIHEAKTQFSKLVRRAEAGEAIEAEDAEIFLLGETERL